MFTSNVEKYREEAEEKYQVIFAEKRSAEQVHITEKMFLEKYLLGKQDVEEKKYLALLAEIKSVEELHAAEKKLLEQKFSAERQLLVLRKEAQEAVLAIVSCPVMQKIYVHIPDHNLVQLCLDYISTAFCKRCKFVFSQNTCPFCIPTFDDFMDCRKTTYTYESPSTWTLRIVGKAPYRTTVYVPTSGAMEDVLFFERAWRDKLKDRSWKGIRIMNVDGSSTEWALFPDIKRAEELLNHVDKTFRFKFTFTNYWSLRDDFSFSVC